MSKEDNKAVGAIGAGAAAGAASSVVAVSTAGTVAGLGATGVTSGLSALGACVGGGMAAGVGVVAALPLLTGGLAYFAYKKLKD